jgi:two-component system response regulator RegX3
VRNSPGGPEPFSQLFNSFIRRQRALQRAGEAGVRLDVGTGHVYVEGRQIPPLTDLEYRLLLLLYGHLDEIVDKYQIVEGVWGQEYIDQVDDSRIERLVGRLREKIEPDPKRPQYLLTVRGRGYRLVG